MLPLKLSCCAMHYYMVVAQKKKKEKVGDEFQCPDCKEWSVLCADGMWRVKGTMKQ